MGTGGIGWEKELVKSFGEFGFKGLAIFGAVEK